MNFYASLAVLSSLINISGMPLFAADLERETLTAEPKLTQRYDSICLDQGRRISPAEPFHLLGLPHYGQLSPEAKQAISILCGDEYFSFSCGFMTPGNILVRYMSLNNYFLTSLYKESVGNMVKAKGHRYDRKDNSYEFYEDFKKMEFCEISGEFEKWYEQRINKFTGQFLIGYVTASWKISSNELAWNPNIRGLLYSLDLTPEGKDFLSSLPPISLESLSDDAWKLREWAYKKICEKLDEGDFFQLTLSSMIS